MAGQSAKVPMENQPDPGTLEITQSHLPAGQAGQFEAVGLPAGSVERLSHLSAVFSQKAILQVQYTIHFASEFHVVGYHEYG